MPTFGAVMRLLHNPTYSGAYVYGQKEYDPFDRSATTGKAKTTARPAADWPVVVPDVYPAYITWESSCGTSRRSETTGSGPAAEGLRDAAKRCSRGSPDAAGAGPE